MTLQSLGGISKLDLLPYAAKRLQSFSTCMMDLLRSDAPILLYRMVANASLLIGRYLVLLLQHHHDNPYLRGTNFNFFCATGTTGAAGAIEASNWTNWSTEATRTRLNGTKRSDIFYCITSRALT